MPNRLAGASSPYLAQHAANPVDWQPWDAAALAEARRDDKPILLSIGYAACHWCHVMAHESFEDAATARVMNARFVCIKVDREERPDLDQIYQRAHAMLTRQSGGWPLTMFLTPDGVPFFGGTYFPREASYGRPAFADLCTRVADIYRAERASIARQNERLVEWMASLEPGAGAEGGAGAVDARAWDDAWDRLAQSFEPVHGGFGKAPKFPHAPELELALARVLEEGDLEARNVLAVTLARMAEGGIHDHLGGGFCRYSVDAEWSIPHFEKMLSDNAMLVGLYAAWGASAGDDAAVGVACDIRDWLLRDMRAPEGAFWSSLDADSEGEEGRFYVWDAGEVRALLDPDAWAVAAPHWGFDRAPNFEHRAWNPRVVVPLVDVAARLSITPQEAAVRLERARATLLDARGRRVPPGLDDKRLTSWNALAIHGLARAARTTEGRVDGEAPAFAALDAVRAAAWRDGRLRATWREGESTLNAYLDDHAFLLAATLECLQLRFRAGDFAFACALADALLERFEDPARGGFFFTSDDHEALILRHKPAQDGATPSGNGVAALALAELAVLAGDMRYAEAAQRAVDVFASMIAQSPEGFATLLRADRALRVGTSVVIVDGEPGAARAMANAARRATLSGDPGAMVIEIAGIAELPPALRKGARIDTGACAWLCRGMTCLPRIDDADALAAVLARPSSIG